MKIRGFDVHHVRVDDKTSWLFLELRTDEDLVGLGEAMLPGRESLAIHALRVAARDLVGTPLKRALPPGAALADDQATGLLEATVRSAVDQCLWDLRARALGAPLHRLLGPTLREDVVLYANINRGTRLRTPEGFAAHATAARAAGFPGVKLAPFDNVSRANVHSAEGRAAFSLGIERVLAVRDAIGSDAMLMVDCHCRLDLTSAQRFLAATRDARIDWFEDVLPYHDLDGWCRLKALGEAPLVGGETARGVRDLLPFVRRGIWDVLMPDIRLFGGVTELVALASLAEQHQVTIAPHNPRGPIATLASAHAMAGCKQFFMLEYQEGECAWRSALVGGAEMVSGGRLALTDGPGIGADLHSPTLTAHLQAEPVRPG